MSGADRDHAVQVLSFKDRCALSLQMRKAGVHIDDIVCRCGWPNRQAAYVAISRAKKPHKYHYKRRGYPGRLAFGGAQFNGKPFIWDEWDEQLTIWVGEGLRRSVMAQRLSEMTGYAVTRNQVIGRIYRIRQRELAKRRIEE